MLAKVHLRSWLPGIGRSTVKAIGTAQRAAALGPSAVAPISLCAPASIIRATPTDGSVIVMPVKNMPTPLISEEQVHEKSTSTGKPPQRGSRKLIVWQRRKTWFTRQWTLDLNRARIGPVTATFPEGTPMTQIRGFKAFSGRAYGINTGVRRKVRHSLKRGRNKKK